MAWIKYTTTLHDCPEVVRMAETLGAEVYSITGRLMKLWTWATDHTTNGDARGVTKAFLDRHVEMPGFSDAMISVGWLTANAKGVTFPKWESHLSNGAKARALTQNRNKSLRSRDAASVTEASPDKRREEKRRSKDKKTSAASPQLFGEPEPEPAQPAELAFPPELDTPAFRAAWDEYTTYRRERKLPKLQARSVASKFAEMAKLGEPAALESIRQTIANGWTGTFAPKTFQGAAGTRGDPLASARLRRASTAQGEYATPIEVREI